MNFIHSQLLRFELPANRQLGTKGIDGLLFQENGRYCLCITRLRVDLPSKIDSDPNHVQIHGTTTCQQPSIQLVELWTRELFAKTPTQQSTRFADK